MSLEEFYKELTAITPMRESRQKCANMVLNDMSLFPKLMDILFMVDDEVSHKAAWVFEYVCEGYISAIIPHLDRFTKNLKIIHFKSAVRPVAKVCEFIATEYDSKKPNTLQKILTSSHKKLIVEACFDWMITSQKVAPKAYAMETLFVFGKNMDWVHKELVTILERDFHKQSAGYKARAKRTLKKIKRNETN